MLLQITKNPEISGQVGQIQCSVSKLLFNKKT